MAFMTPDKIIVPALCAAAFLLTMLPPSAANNTASPAAAALPAAAVPATVPGSVIAHYAGQAGRYVGSPSLAVLPDGAYLATHDLFGPHAGDTRRGVTRVFRSIDQGATWQPLADLTGLFWATLFLHRGALYLMGTDHEYGAIVIRRSDDGGKTWTEAGDANSGLLRSDGEYHTAPVPVVVHQGRLWRAMEDRNPPQGWGVHFRAFMMSAPVDADLLRAGSWTLSNRLARDSSWNGGDFGAWLEGNAVVTPDGHIVDILRVDTKSPDEKVALIHISDDGKTATFDPHTGLIGFPGGAKKFTIRYDPRSKLYWSLATIVPERYRAPSPGGIRNTLALTCSPDLYRWTVRSILLHHPDTARHGFQYVDWLVAGDDIIAVCRTAYDDSEGGAHNNHDANYLTFLRVPAFRTRTPQDAPLYGVNPATARRDGTGKEKSTP